MKDLFEHLGKQIEVSNRLTGQLENDIKNFGITMDEMKKSAPKEMLPDLEAIGTATQRIFNKAKRGEDITADVESLQQKFKRKEKK